MTDTTSFEWRGGKVTVQKPNGFSRQRVWRMRQALARLDDLKGIDYADAASMCYYLANTAGVEGSIGFNVPHKDPTPEEVLTFVMELGNADEDLIGIWDNALYNLKSASNDPDLLPPDELDAKKKIIQTSEQSD